MDDDDAGDSDVHTDVDDEDGDSDDAADGYGHGDTDDGVGNDAGDVLVMMRLLFGDTNLAHCWQSPAAWTWLGPEHTPFFEKNTFIPCIRVCFYRRCCVIMRAFLICQ